MPFCFTMIARLGRCRAGMLLWPVFALTMSVCFIRFVSAQEKSEQGTLLPVMQAELSRAMGILGKTDPAAYFMSYSVIDQETTVIGASLGAIMNSLAGRARTVDVVVRVGDPKLDNTHGMPAPPLASDLLPLDDNPEAIAHSLWRLTDAGYKMAATAYLNIKTRSAVRAGDEDPSPDFSTEPAQVRIDLSKTPPAPGVKAWEERLRRYSAGFRKYPEVYASSLQAQFDRTRTSFTSSEGTAITQPGTLARIIIQAYTRADDGMELQRGDVLQSPAPERLPAEAEILARIDRIAADLKALRSAPVAEPFDGPALLSGDAAAVFFHEVIGHRLEGNRQRGNEEGQTFTKMVNQQILPEFLTIITDPALRELNGIALTGAYDFDQEGVPASRVDLVVNGILKNFLMSRLPIRGFEHSNGHGRKQPGVMASARQSNLIVNSGRMVSDAKLRSMLIDEAKKQGKAYGLYFENMLGGFTITQRSMPQSFQLLPVMVWRVYCDGRPDELIRGADIVGTPLATLRTIVATGEKMSVFNGMCGAESGQIPVSAAAPAMLFSNLEIQKRTQSRLRPPILPPPGFEGKGAGSAGSRSPRLEVQK